MSANDWVMGAALMVEGTILDDSHKAVAPENGWGLRSATYSVGDAVLYLFDGKPSDETKGNAERAVLAKVVEEGQTCPLGGKSDCYKVSYSSHFYGDGTAIVPRESLVDA